ncbi:hypothetical protein OKW39_002274 [Paraburkholderia sp. MM6662-R1]
MSTPGVRDVHEMRTRKMGDFALVDAHILVDPMISVSEGHYIAESARLRVLTDKRVLDALIHVDPENDALAHPPVDLPPRERVTAEVDAALAAWGLQAAGINLHYLSTGLDVEVVLPAAASVEGRAADGPEAACLLESEAQSLGRIDLEALKRRLGARKLDVLLQRDISAAQGGPAAELQTGVAPGARSTATEPHNAA